MKLNLDMIFQKLPKTYQIKQFGPINHNRTLGRPYLYEAGCEMHPSQLYVARADALPPPGSENISLICVGNRLPHSWVISNNPILLIFNTESVLSVFNVIHEVFNLYDDWEQQLQTELLKDMEFDIKEILLLGTRMLENPICVTDHNVQIVLSTQFVQDPDGSLQVVVDDSLKSLNIEYRSMIKEVCWLERSLTVSYLTQITLDGYKVYCYNLYLMGHFAGCIYAREICMPFSEGNYPLMDYFFQFFQKAFQKHLRFNQAESPRISMVRNLLIHSPLSATEQEQLSLLTGEQWICFKLSENRHVKYMPKDYMLATLVSLMPRSVHADIYHDEIIGMLRLGEQEQCQNDINLFSEILSRMAYTAGFSNEFTDTNNLDSYFLQADFAAARGSEHKSTESIFYFRDYILEYMLNECTGKMPEKTLYTKGLQTLVEYDKRKGTDHLKTLDVFLQNEMNIAKSSEVLYIHRSSLLKRLEKIKLLLDNNLNDSDLRLYLRICLRLMKQQDREVRILP